VPQTSGHDIVVIGASAGGIEALKELLQQLTPDLPAALFIVLHLGARSHLAHILARHCPLPVVAAESGAKIEPGRVTIGVPRRHLVLHDRHILLSRGPRENLSRPAVDVLFRSAAATFGGRVIGIVLSGALNDGTAGLSAIKRCGGCAVVQDPADATVASMPRSALAHVQIDLVAPVAEIGRALDRLVRQPSGTTPDIPLEIRLEAAIAAQELGPMHPSEMPGTLAPFTCPECHGSLWEMDDPDLLRYRCHAGHAFTAETILAARRAEVDSLLEKLLRSHQERAALARRMAKEERRRNRGPLADLLEGRAKDYDNDAELVRRLARSGGGTAPTDMKNGIGDYLENEAAEE
jgi:two-component system chemotaxis response regulator CheB